jgi:hypothetical protein
MDGSRFDALIKIVAAPSRRSLLATGGIAALAGFFGLAIPEDAQAKCKKKCGPCRRCKKGKCKKKKPDGTRCGPCSHCDGGRCQSQCPSEQCRNDVCEGASCTPPCEGCSICENGQCRELCPSEDCFEDDGEEFCRVDCDPACDLCHTCNQSTGDCEADCEPMFCTEDGCRVPCDPACEACTVCQLDLGECFEQCTSEECEADICEIPCSPACGANRECFAGTCFPVCDEPCDAGKGCIAGNTCIALAGDCPASADSCATGEIVSCFAGNVGGQCVKLNDGASFCASSVQCPGCVTDLDCQNWGLGPNSRCIADCDFCNGNGGAACVRFAGG